MVLQAPGETPDPILPLFLHILPLFHPILILFHHILSLFHLILILRMMQALGGTPDPILSLFFHILIVSHPILILGMLWVLDNPLSSFSHVPLGILADIPHPSSPFPLGSRGEGHKGEKG